ncbi:hypothetical protein [Bifidobacterium thermophilum]|uniref:hypothetical protein n=1 Tax=Bifidobacterium thermophilum TaxID=33905 RepID=UPI0030B1BBE6
MVLRSRIGITVANNHGNHAVVMPWYGPINSARHPIASAPWIRVVDPDGAEKIPSAGATMQLPHNPLLFKRPAERSWMPLQ